MGIKKKGLHKSLLDTPAFCLCCQAPQWKGWCHHLPLAERKCKNTIVHTSLSGNNRGFSTGSTCRKMPLYWSAIMLCSWSWMHPSNKCQVKVLLLGYGVVGIVASSGGIQLDWIIKQSYPQSLAGLIDSLIEREQLIDFRLVSSTSLRDWC